MKQLAIGPLMIDIAGDSLSSLDREKIAHPNTGGIILFSRNFESPEQIAALNQGIRKARQGEILIAVDQEGGRVQRFQSGFTPLPSAASYATQPELAISAGWLMAAELISVNVDFSFAPVLDVDAGVSEIIGNRSFSSNAALAANLASNFRQGMRNAGMAAVGKHFPGHGSVAQDSHLTLPIDNRNLENIQHHDLIPFRRLISEGLEAIMPAHIVYPAVDSLPACFSAIWLETILRQQLEFKGAVFSDDLSMAGAAAIGDFPERAALALDAGCDMLLICNNYLAAEDLLDKIKRPSNNQSHALLQNMRCKTQVNRHDLFHTDKWQQLTKQFRQLRESHA